MGAKLWQRPQKAHQSLCSSWLQAICKATPDRQSNRNSTLDVLPTYSSSGIRTEDLCLVRRGERQSLHSFHGKQCTHGADGDRHALSRTSENIFRNRLAKVTVQHSISVCQVSHLLVLFANDTVCGTHQALTEQHSFAQPVPIPAVSRVLACTEGASRKAH